MLVLNYIILNSYNAKILLLPLIKCPTEWNHSCAYRPITQNVTDCHDVASASVNLEYKNLKLGLSCNKNGFLLPHSKKPVVQIPNALCGYIYWPKILKISLMFRTYICK